MLPLVLAVLGVGAAPAGAFTVNSTGDGNDLNYPNGGNGKCDADGATPGRQCTLRAAIWESNRTQGPDEIDFDIPGGGVQTITPGGPLPTVSKPVKIDGYTQPGSSPNTSADPTTTNAQITVQLAGPYSGIHLDGADDSLVRGLSIGGCGSSCGHGISVRYGSGNRVQGNFVGVAADGVTGNGNSIGLAVSNASDTTIGGGSPAARNLVSANVSLGVYIVNYVSDTLVKGNLIGLNRNGNALGNGNDGIRVGAFSQGNRFLSNSIYANSGLGIDLPSAGEDASGVTPNDPDNPATAKPDPDSDPGPNRLQNYPVLNGAQLFNDPFSGGFAVGGGTLESVRSTSARQEDFRIQFFASSSADPSTYGEGRRFVGQQTVTTNGQGVATFNYGTAGGISEGDHITATATRLRTGDTSEFSRRVVVQPPVIGP